MAGFFIMPYFVYILRSIKDGSYYIGSTQDLSSRLERHNQGRSKYTNANRPWEVIYSEKHSNRSAAMKREREIKKRKSREYIERLVRTSRQT
jgi:putative endonuclease